MQINQTKNFSLFTLDQKIYGLKKGVHNVLSHSYIFTQAIVDILIRNLRRRIGMLRL